MTPDRVAVIDIGKTNVKLALVETADLSEIAVVTRPNVVLADPPYPHFDVEAIWTFLLDGLERFHHQHGIDAISITTHGASGALIAQDGSLAAPVMDYEHTGPDQAQAIYDAIRPFFEETGAPRLPMGLNLGAQIHWQFLQDPDLRRRAASIVTYPQYWGFRLSGVLACDVSSLGCHTDLWDPFRGRFSSLVDQLDIADKMAPARKSADVLGPVLPDIARHIGLGPETPVLCGIHDSNASLLPHVLQRDPPFSVVSTGTWVIAMTIGGASISLDPARDTLVNVNALGAPVPSARFMGGREYEILQNGETAECDGDTIARAAETGPLLMPAVVAQSGPFQEHRHHWIGPEPAPGSPVRAATVGFYLAMMTAECLSLTGHRGPVVVEGPFGTNDAYCAMLAAATGCAVLAAEGTTGTSQGAALLALGTTGTQAEFKVRRFDPKQGQHYADYAQRWRMSVAG